MYVKVGDRMIILNSIIPNVFVVISSYFLYKLINCFTPIKKHILRTIISFPIIFVVVGVMIYPKDILNVLGIFFLFLLMMLFLFQGSLIQKLSVVLILYPIIISINLLIEDIGLQLWRIGGSSVYLDGILHSLLYLFRIFVWWFIYRFFRKYIVNCGTLITTRMWIVIDIVCLAPLFAMISFILFTPNKTLSIYPASFACIMTSLGCIYLTGYIAATIKTELENRNLKLQQTYYQELERNQHTIRKLRHDMNNHLSVIAALIEDNDKDKVSSYFQELSVQFAVSGRTFCTNSIVNAVINTKYNLIMENSIDCFLNIDINHMLAIDDINLCSIFANTIDNAIEASLQIVDVTKRRISVKARYDKGYFSYEIINTKENAVQREQDTFFTTKKNKKVHGFGLENVRGIVEQYKGTLDVSYDDNIFSVVILIGNV